MAIAQQGAAYARAEPADPQLLALKVPPHSIEAEQSMLGALLLDNQAFDRVADLVTGADFYRDDHRRIWRHISKLIEAGRPADVQVIAEPLDIARHTAGVEQQAGCLQVFETGRRGTVRPRPVMGLVYHGGFFKGAPLQNLRRGKRYLLSPRRQDNISTVAAVRTAENLFRHGDVGLCHLSSPWRASRLSESLIICARKERLVSVATALHHS